MTKLFVSRRAEADLREIWRYIAAENPDAADRVLLRLEEKCRLLTEFPRIGPLRNDIRRAFRMLVEGNYHLLYEYDADLDAVDLIAVVDGLRDLSGLF